VIRCFAGDVLVVIGDARPDAGGVGRYEAELWRQVHAN
jgi:hypothetical protein